jgi:hypothetical protein
MKTKHLISNWEIWKELCSSWKIDPYENIEWGEDRGGGDSMTWEYIGDIPEKEEE